MGNTMNKNSNIHHRWSGINTKSLSLRISEGEHPKKAKAQLFNDFGEILEEWWSFYENEISITRNGVQAKVKRVKRYNSGDGVGSSIHSEISVNMRPDLTVYVGGQSKKFSADESLYNIMLWVDRIAEKRGAFASNQELRNKIIRLAYEQPQLRSDLLPLVTKSANYSEHYRGDTVDVISDIQSACHRAGLECKAYDKKMFGSMIPHIEIIGDRSSIAKVMRKFKTKAVKTALSKISVDMDAVQEAVSDAVYNGRPQWNVDADYDLRWLQYGILIKSRVEFVIKGDVSGIYTQRDFGTRGERFLIVSDNKGKAQKECEQHAIDSLYSAFEEYNVPFDIVGVRSRMDWLEDTGNGACSLEITCK